MMDDGKHAAHCANVANLAPTYLTLPSLMP